MILNFIYLLSISGTIAERKVIFKSFPARLLLDPYYLIIILQNTIENTKCRGRLKVVVSKCKAFNNLPDPLSLPWVYILIFISDLLSSSYVLVHTFSAISFSCFLFDSPHTAESCIFDLHVAVLTRSSLVLCWSDTSHLEWKKSGKDIVISLFVTFSPPGSFSEDVY